MGKPRSVITRVCEASRRSLVQLYGVRRHRPGTLLIRLGRPRRVDCHERLQEVATECRSLHLRPIHPTSPPLALGGRPRWKMLAMSARRFLLMRTADPKEGRNGCEDDLPGGERILRAVDE